MSAAQQGSNERWTMHRIRRVSMIRLLGPNLVCDDMGSGDEVRAVRRILDGSGLRSW